jgi:hypothetical protein
MSTSFPVIAEWIFPAETVAEEVVEVHPAF